MNEKAEAEFRNEQEADAKREVPFTPEKSKHALKVVCRAFIVGPHKKEPQRMLKAHRANGRTTKRLRKKVKGK